MIRTDGTPTVACPERRERILKATREQLAARASLEEAQRAILSAAQVPTLAETLASDDTALD